MSSNGSMSNDNSMSNSSANSGSNSSMSSGNGKMDHQMMQAIKVNDVKMISDHCSMKMGKDMDKDMDKDKKK